MRFLPDAGRPERVLWWWREMQSTETTRRSAPGTSPPKHSPGETL
nr:MAG TPA: hypothetical protein [Caudoviricetes sp.]